MRNKLCVIGIGYRPLDARSKEIVLKAEVILASNRLYEVFKGYKEFKTVKDRIRVINKVPETIDFIRKCFLRSPLSPVVLLASGDPCFFGIGRRMIEEFGREQVEILPDVSSMQEAFARINMPWDDAFLISLHGGVQTTHRHTIDDVPVLLRKHGKIAALTDRTRSPSEIARRILASALADSVTMHVCQCLGYPDQEAVITGTPLEIAEQGFSDPNVVILIYAGKPSHDVPTSFGLKEEDFSHSRGLITKDEVRAASIHALRLPGQGVLWDVGAGCGSVSIEAARLSPGLVVYAVEKEEAQASHIRANIRRFGVPNILVLIDKAPQALMTLPQPERVFIGGGGKENAGIIDAVSQRMEEGIIVINAVTLETLGDAISSLEGAGFTVEVCQIGISRSRSLAGRKHLLPLTQVFIIKGERM